MDDRRRHDRHRVCFPVKLDGANKPDRLGMCRNAGVTGMLFGTPSRFQIGDQIMLTFRINADHDASTQVRARVVRLGMDRLHRDSWCHRLVAVEFDAPIPEIETYLLAEEPRQRSLFEGALT